jgi:hypothetical protein
LNHLETGFLDKLRFSLDEPHFLVAFVIWFYPIAFLMCFGLLLAFCNLIAISFGAPLYTLVPRFSLTFVCYFLCVVCSCQLFRVSSWMRRSMFYLITVWLLTCAVFDVTGRGFFLSLEHAAGRPIDPPGIFWSQ